MKFSISKAAFAGFILSVQSIAHAGLILEVDLTVENTISINATSASSLITISGHHNDGFYLADFFGIGANEFEIETSGSLTSANESSNSDGTPELSSPDSDNGLNIFSYLNIVDSTFTADSLAFSGQASWTVSSAIYADALNGALSGNVYFPADEFSDISSNGLLGTWQATVSSVPEPSTLALLVLGTIGIASRRSK